MVEKFKWGPVLVGRVTPLFPPSFPEKLGWALYQHPGSSLLG